MTSDFLIKLSKSPTVVSLRAEQRACRLLTRRKWKCFQGAFYRDVKEDKLREADVIARRIWTRGTGAKRQVARLSLVIEAKSAKDWHLLFAGRIAKKNVGHTLRIWSGLMDTRYEWLRESLRRNRVPENAIPRLVERFEEYAFPEERAVLANMFVEAPPAGTTATTFRETNIEKEKDLEASVLWRAMSALRSATNSLTQDALERHKENFDLLDRIPFGTGDFMHNFDESCKQSIGHVDFFHPVVLIDAHPWIAHGNQTPRKVSSCRFYQLDPLGNVTWWCDVVHSDAFEDFAATTTAFYDSFFRKRRAKRMTLPD